MYTLQYSHTHAHFTRLRIVENCKKLHGWKCRFAVIWICMCVCADRLNLLENRLTVDCRRRWVVQIQMNTYSEPDRMEWMVYLTARWRTSLRVVGIRCFTDDGMKQNLTVWKSLLLLLLVRLFLFYFFFSHSDYRLLLCSYSTAAAAAAYYHCCSFTVIRLFLVRAQVFLFRFFSSFFSVLSFVLVISIHNIYSWTFVRNAHFRTFHVCVWVWVCLLFVVWNE